MHIVVPMAGHSRRFAEAGYKDAKFLLPIGDKLMLGHVVDMFSPEDCFHFLINEEQANNYPNLIQTLRRLVPNPDLTVINSHELGPTYTALKVQNILDDEPLIISYCDFTISWSYQHFLRHAEGHDAAMPVFKGFHPASCGTTNYAYIRNDGHRMLELREKKSFTNDRTSEYASVGIYYFDTWKIFKRYAKTLLNSKLAHKQEAYVSLVNNLLVEDGLDVVLHPVSKFICLGTPDDVEQYNFWYKRFSTPIQKFPTVIHPRSCRQVNIIPMAGQGNRFIDAGYRLAKPLIPVGGTPMMIQAAKSCPPADHWIFLSREEDISKHPIKNTIENHFPKNDTTIVPVPILTSGQAATCLLAKTYIDPDDHLFIASCDYEHSYNNDLWNEILEDKSIDGVIWTHRMRGGLFKDPYSFAYCMLGDDKRLVKQVVEKNTISDDPKYDPLVVGSFWFRRASNFFIGAENMINENITVNGEHYVGTSINQLITKQLRFVIFDVKQWISFGDPFDLRIFEYWESYFYSR